MRRGEHRSRCILVGMGALVTLVCTLTSTANAQNREDRSRSASYVCRSWIGTTSISRDSPSTTRREVGSEASRRTTTASCGSARTSGVYRYDGYRLEHYQHEPGDPASLSADGVWTVYKDRAGTHLDRNGCRARPRGRES